MGTLGTIALIFITVVGVLACIGVIFSDHDYENMEIDWDKTTFLGIVYKRKPSKVIMVETHHDKKTDTTKSVIVIPPSINVSDVKIRIDSDGAAADDGHETSGKSSCHPDNGKIVAADGGKITRRVCHEPDFDIVSHREPSYDVTDGHEPDFDIFSYDEVTETVTNKKSAEPSYNDICPREPRYD
ncbi:MAG: hypothetical protein NC230_09275 [Bacteroides sp.]|nr:hypothetical protein [Bacteroides sp.]